MRIFDLVCFGEIVIDDYGKRKVLAGAPLNAASVARALGLKTALVSAVNEDDRDRISTLVGTRGITPIIQANELPTGKARVRLDSMGVPTFELDCESAFDSIRKTGLEDIETEYILFGSLGIRGGITRRTINKLLDGGESVGFFDMNIRGGFKNMQAFAEAIKRAEYVKANEDEMMFYESLDQRYLFGDKCVFLTLGEMGAKMRGKTNAYSGAPNVDVKDTTGCGDTFCAAAIYGIKNRWDMETTLSFAVKLASANAGFAGAFSREFAKWLAQAVKRMSITGKDISV